MRQHRRPALGIAWGNQCTVRLLCDIERWDAWSSTALDGLRAAA